MPSVCRDGDATTGICNPGLPCCPHGRTGTISEVSNNVFVNGLGVHRLNDTGPTNCPHGGTFATTSGSGTVFVNGRPIVRVGDSTVCTACGQGGSHTTGSGNVFAGG